MTNPPYGPGGQWLPPGSPGGPPPAWPAVATRQSRALVVVSLVVALIAVAVAIGSWFRPVPETSTTADAVPQFTDQQISDAKNAVCGAYDKTKRAITGAATQTSPDPTLTLLIAVNTRLATQFSSRYVMDTLKANPATPGNLSDGIRKISAAWDGMVLAQLSGAGRDDPELKPLFTEIDSSDVEIGQACK